MNAYVGRRIHDGFLLITPLYHSLAGSIRLDKRFKEALSHFNVAPHSMSTLGGFTDVLIPNFRNLGART